MPRKRRNTSSAEADESPPAKRRVSPLSVTADDDHELDEKAHKQPRLDSIYGQQGAFPGLDDEDDELFYGPASDGLEYLRMVRSEAKTVPLLLTANRVNARDEEPTEVEWGETDKAFHNDEAFVAPPLIGPVQTEGTLPRAQARYYQLLLRRYEELHATLQTDISDSIIETLGSTKPLTFPAESTRATEQWKRYVKQRDPELAQLACLTNESVWELLKLLKRSFHSHFQARDLKILHRYGAWLWAVLSRARPLEVLGSEEVAELRVLGKLAVGFQAQFLDKQIDNDQDHLVDESGCNGQDAATENADEDEDVDHARLPDTMAGQAKDQNIDEAKHRLSGMLAASGTAIQSCTGTNGGGTVGDEQSQLEWRSTAMMIVDMVVTIIGEVFGQRDLLEQREKWAA